jgi:hypothetical protein
MGFSRNGFVYKNNPIAFGDEIRHTRKIPGAGYLLLFPFQAYF